MMNRRIAAAIVLMLAAGTVAHAQLNLRNLKDAAKKGLDVSKNRDAIQLLK